MKLGKRNNIATENCLLRLYYEQIARKLTKYTRDGENVPLWNSMNTNDCLWEEQLVIKGNVKYLTSNPLFNPNPRTVTPKPINKTSFLV